MGLCTKVQGPRAPLCVVVACPPPPDFDATKWRDMSPIIISKYFNMIFFSEFFDKRGWRGKIFGVVAARRPGSDPIPTSVPNGLTNMETTLNIGLVHAQLRNWYPATDVLGEVLSRTDRNVHNQGTKIGFGQG